MRYFFESKIELKENGGFMHIPFNVWEVCRQREVIKADVVLDQENYDCELLPIDKGNYMIHLKKEVLENIDVEHVHEVLLHVKGSLIKMKQDSPYSVEQPVRNIGQEGIELIKQKNDGLCGQAVVAMLAGTSIPEVMEVMECREWQATMGRVISALNYYGIDHDDIIYYTQGRTDFELPDCCIMMEKMGRFSHYLLHYNGRFYDPTLGLLDAYDKSKLLGYLEIRY